VWVWNKLDYFICEFNNINSDFDWSAKKEHRENFARFPALYITNLAYQWTGVKNVILYTQDKNGDENTNLFKISIAEANIQF
jgi:hypothetical protein